MAGERENQPLYSSQVQAYLRDESGLTGTAEEICLPQDMEGIQSAIAYAKDKKSAVTIQGARTGLCGGAVPSGGVIVNLSRMNRVLGFAYEERMGTGWITVQAGVTLGQLREYLQKKVMDTSALPKRDLQAWEAYQKSRKILHFLPNPTEQNATIGGIAATGALGPHIAQDQNFIHNLLGMKVVLGNGEIVEVGVPSWQSSKEGQNIGDKMAWMSSMCGTEGTLGVIAQLTLKLSLQPESSCGFLSFHHTFQSMDRFYREFSSAMDRRKAQIASADWFSKSCFEWIRESSQSTGKKDLGFSFPPTALCALWVKLWGKDEQELCEVLETALEQMETEDNFNELALAAIGQTETQRLEMLRHQATEAANLQNGKDTAMLDWQTGSDPLKAAAKIDHLLKAGGAEYILMGHMACGIANLRILKDADNWKKEVMELLRTMECEYAQEHGCGRIKWDLLTHLSPLWAEKWKMMKLEKDPEKILNPTII